MSGVTLSDLSKYHQGAMKWFRDGLVSEHNKLFAQTGEAGAVSFWPLGGTPLEGKVEFSFKETPPASGDKGPENPSTISGVSSIAVGKCGKNVMPKNTVTYNGYGLTISYNSDGCLVLDGTYTGGNTQRYYANTDGSSLFGSIVPCSMKLDLNKQYKFWAKLISGSVSGASFGFVFGNKAHQMTTSSSNWSIGTVISLSIPAGYCDLFIVRTNLNANIVFDHATLQLQLEEGSEITDFEPPMSASEIKNSIQLGDTYYGGEIDLATGVMTVTHYCFTVDENTGYSPSIGLVENTDSYRLAFYPDKERVKNPYAIGDAIYCDRFPVRSNASEVIIVGLSSVNLQITLLKSRLGLGDGASFAEVQTAFKTFFASHPTKLVYPIAAPFTVQLTPLQLTALTQKDKYTPRMNTLYTDADSIQAVYRKSLIHDEDEKVQAIVALGGNV